MKAVTNKTLFNTMIIIGVVIVALIIPLYGNGSLRMSNLGATAYLGTENIDQGLFRNSRGVYIPVLNTNYPVSAYRTSNTRTITTTSETPSTTQTYYYTTYDNGQSLPDESGYYEVNYGYTPPGCESGTDYSLTTGEPCG